MKGSLGFYDPRQLKQFLEDKGLSVWMDIDKVAQVIIGKELVAHAGN